MTVDPTTPADTTMMRIVHDAVRRDLRRARRALLAQPPPDTRQRDAIAEQLRWMMDFLEAHHRSEDDGLYRLVRERDPGAAVLLDDMAADHRAVAVAIDRVREAAAPGTTAAPPAELVGALDDLTDVLLPHLRREEDEAMPIVSRSITSGEWQALEEQHNLAGKSMAQLGREGHWLIDDASAEDRAVVLGLVPPIPRMVLLAGFGPSARRRAARCWHPRRRIPHAGGATVVVDAGIEAVWEVVRDPTRVGEWSHECVEARWMADDHEPRVGARFRGRNAQGLVRWGRVCEIVRLEPHEVAWRTIPSVIAPDSSEWTIRLTPVDDARTRIDQTYEIVKGTALEPLYATVLPAHRDRTDALERDLARIGALAGRTVTRDSPVR